MKTKILKIKEVVVDFDLYPRKQHSWQTTYDYTQSLKAGAKFPAITVALYDKHYVLVDGLHRLRAYEAMKQKHIQAEVLTGLDRKQIYLEAVKRNVIHGRQFSVQEKVMVVQKLREFKMPLDEISKTIQIPKFKIKDFVAKRITNTITGEEITLKKPLQNLAGVTVSEYLEEKQDLMEAASQYRLLEDLVTILENEWIDLNNRKVCSKLIEITELIKPLQLTKE